MRFAALTNTTRANTTTPANVTTWTNAVTPADLTPDFADAYRAAKEGVKAAFDYDSDEAEAAMSTSFGRLFPVDASPVDVPAVSTRKSGSGRPKLDFFDVPQKTNRARDARDRLMLRLHLVDRTKLGTPHDKKGCIAPSASDTRTYTAAHAMVRS